MQKDLPTTRKRGEGGGKEKDFFGRELMLLLAFALREKERGRKKNEATLRVPMPPLKLSLWVSCEGVVLKWEQERRCRG